MRRSLGITSIAAAAAAAIAASATPAASSSPSVVAAANGRTVAVYRSPGLKHPFVVLKNPNADGGELVFLVAQRMRGWERVYLPMRPNGTTGWIRDRAVRLALDPFRVEVLLGRHLVRVWRGSRVVATEKAGVGRSVLPTPRGTYFLAELLRQPDPNGLYGPYAFGLSAFSNVLYTFGGGPGEIGLHGTNDPQALGTDVSHGCIRISNAGITRLARLLPLGTPVLIRS